jgi:hypothetical protein
MNWNIDLKTLRNQSCNFLQKYLLHFENFGGYCTK